MMVHNSLEWPSVELYPEQTTEEHCFKKKHCLYNHLRLT